MSNRRQHKSAILVALLFQTLASGSAKAAVSENLQYSYYTANAEPGRSLLGAMNMATPIRQNGEVFHGFTRWDVRWNFRWFESANGRCRITDTTTSLSATITLPKLTGADRDQAAVFEPFVTALRAHELGHYAIGKEAASTVDFRIRNLPEMASCPALESAANQTGHATLEEFRQRELRYDATTGHGRTQGAVMER